MMRNNYQTLFHLLQGERARGVVANLHQFHASEPADAQRRNDAQVAQLHRCKSILDPKNYLFIIWKKLINILFISTSLVPTTAARWQPHT